MTWSKLDDSFYDCPKILAAGNEATGVFARALTYCGRHNTDGKVPKVQAQALANGKRSIPQKLVDVVLWVDKGDHYFIPDYLDFNPSRLEVEAQRKKNAERQRKLRGNA